MHNPYRFTKGGGILKMATMETNRTHKTEEKLTTNRPNLLRRNTSRIAITLLALSSVAASNSETVGLYGDLAGKNVVAFARDINPFEDEPDPTTFDAIEYRFSVGDGLYTSDDYGNYTSIWPHSQVVSAYQLVRLLDDGADQYEDKYYKALSATNYYWNGGSGERLPGYDAHIPAPLSRKKERFVDDNLWLGLILVQEYKKTGNTEALQKAEQIFALAMDQWDHDRGGIYWQVQWDADDNTRAIVSAAPGVMIGADLFQITKDQDYLDQSKQIFAWITQLEDTNERLYNDHMRIDGSYEPSKWSYVQGVVAGAMAALSQVDPENYSLSDAVAFADHTLIAYQEGRLMKQPEFDAIYFQNLVWIAGLYNQPEFTNRVQSALAYAVDSLPERQDDLLSSAGAQKLYILAQLPEQTYQYVM